MITFQANLTNCDHEPIHIPGQIQSHGFLIVLNQDKQIRFYSDNIADFIPGLDGNLLGKPLQYIETALGNSYQPDFIGQLIKSGKNLDRNNPVPVEIAGVSYYLIISLSRDNYVLEFESSISNFDLDVQSMMGRSIAQILSYRKTQELFDNTCNQVRQIIQFDRIMIYRFAKDGHGEVVAETKNDDLEPWLGLHYPASDIPRQARELYKLNLTRLIADVNTVPSKITASAADTEALDLTYSQLRAVSPIHIQYLKNMGVASSFSISLMYKNELWGLIACHNYTPRFIDYKSREYAKLIGQILSSALEFRQDEETQRAQDLVKISLEKLARQLLETEDTAKALTAMQVTFWDVVNSGGAVLAFDKKIYKLGNTPTDEQLLHLLKWVNEYVGEPTWQTNCLHKFYADAVDYRDIASGMMVSVLSKELGDHLIWFKPEQTKTINWAGNPNKQIETGANGLMHISPRHSFEVWTQSVSGIAIEWTNEEMFIASRLKDDINHGINLKAGAMRLMNERLRQAYLELETFSYTISHDLKSPISSIKSYAQLLIRDNAVLERGQKMLQRIADRADQMNLMINAVLDYSRIGRSAMIYQTINTGNLVSDIVKDLEMAQNNNQTNITIGHLPEMKGDPIMILQVFSNLIGNAVKYSQYANPANVHIEGRVHGKSVRYFIKDNGIGIAPADLPKIFELFNRMENVKDIEGSGVGLAIVKRIIEKHNGTIHAESELNKGSVFHVTFNNSN